MNGNGDGNGKSGFLKWAGRNLWLVFITAVASFIVSRIGSFNWFDTGRFLPRGVCYGWDGPLIWTQVVADSLIGLGFIAIPIQLIYIYRRRTQPEWSALNAPLHVYPAFLWYGLFIFLCGIAHMFDVISIWKPYFILDGFIRLLAAISTLGAVTETQLHISRVNESKAIADLERKYDAKLEAMYRELKALRDKKASG